MSCNSIPTIFISINIQIDIHELDCAAKITLTAISVLLNLNPLIIKKTPLSLGYESNSFISLSYYVF